MSDSLHLSENNKKILNEIIDSYRDQFDFFAFGSRVKGTHKQYSDLDIAVVDKKKVGLARLKNAFEDSDLSITIDIVDLEMIDTGFRELVGKESIKL